LHPSSKNVGVSYATGGGTATGGTDYTIANGTLSFGPLETTKTLTVEVKGDLVDEPDETFFVNLSNPQNATLADAQGQVTIRDDDVGGALTVNDVSVAEGNTGTKDAVFTVSLGVPAASTITVQYTVAAGTASANDFTPNTGKLVFQVGQSSRTLAVKVKGDLFDEDDETFFVRLTSAQGAPISDGEGVGTILDDDLPPSLRVTDVTITEGNSGTKDATFVVSLSLASGKTVTVGYGTADDTAIAGSDYVATSGVLTFAPGETSKSVNVAVKGDKVKESAETFFLNLANPLNATVADAQGVGTIKDGGRGRRGRVRGGGAGLGFPPLAREDPLEERQGPAHAAGADEEVPDGLALLPPDGVGGVAQRAEKVGLRGRAPQDRAPAVEVAIGAPVALFELPRAHVGGAEDGVASVIEVPVAVQEAPLRLHPSKQLRARVGREHVEGRGLDALRDRPLHRALEDRGVVLVEAKDEARVHHDAQVVQAADGRPVVPAQVLPLALRAEALRSQRLEPHEQAPEPAGDRLFEKAGP
jgi:disulfide oxidoreductase YuzD